MNKREGLINDCYFSFFCGYYFPLFSGSNFPVLTEDKFFSVKLKKRLVDLMFRNC